MDIHPDVKVEKKPMSRGNNSKIQFIKTAGLAALLAHPNSAKTISKEEVSTIHPGIQAQIDHNEGIVWNAIKSFTLFKPDDVKVKVKFTDTIVREEVNLELGEVEKLADDKLKFLRDNWPEEKDCNEEIKEDHCKEDTDRAQKSFSIAERAWTRVKDTLKPLCIQKEEPKEEFRRRKRFSSKFTKYQRKEIKPWKSEVCINYRAKRDFGISFFVFWFFVGVIGAIGVASKISTDFTTAKVGKLKAEVIYSNQIALEQAEENEKLQTEISANLDHQDRMRELGDVAFQFSSEARELGDNILDRTKFQPDARSLVSIASHVDDIVKKVVDDILPKGLPLEDVQNARLEMVENIQMATQVKYRDENRRCSNTVLSTEIVVLVPEVDGRIYAEYANSKFKFTSPHPIDVNKYFYSNQYAIDIDTIKIRKNLSTKISGRRIVTDKSIDIIFFNSTQAMGDKFMITGDVEKLDNVFIECNHTSHSNKTMTTTIRIGSIQTLPVTCSLSHPKINMTIIKIHQITKEGEGLEVFEFKTFTVISRSSVIKKESAAKVHAVNGKLRVWINENADNMDVDEVAVDIVTDALDSIPYDIVYSSATAAGFFLLAIGFMGVWCYKKPESLGGLGGHIFHIHNNNNNTNNNNNNNEMKEKPEEKAAEGTENPPPPPYTPAPTATKSSAPAVAEIYPQLQAQDPTERVSNQRERDVEQFQSEVN